MADSQAFTVRTAPIRQGDQMISTMDRNDILFAFSFTLGALLPEQLIPRTLKEQRKVTKAPVLPGEILKTYDLDIYNELYQEWQKILQFFKEEGLYGVAHRYDKSQRFIDAGAATGFDVPFSNIF